MKLGIIGAMEEEMAAVKPLIAAVETEMYHGRSFLAGRIGEHKVVYTRCDVGKVNAAVATQMLIDRYEVDAVLNMGSAGAIDPQLEVGDIVIATDTVEHDVDLTGWGVDAGAVMFDVYLAPESGRLNFKVVPAFKTDEALRTRLQTAIDTADLRPIGERTPAVHTGRVLSSDAFVNDADKVAWLRNTFGGLCTDMEAAAVAHTCYLSGTPCIIIRTISDRADGEATVAFHTFLKVATENYGRIVAHFLE